MPHPDQKYIEGLVRNDATVIEEIYVRFSLTIKKLISLYNGNEADAADIFQEGLMCIYHKAKKGNLVLTCPFEALLYAICRNKWLVQLKKRRSARVTFFQESIYTTADESFILAEDCLLSEERQRLLLEKVWEIGGQCGKLLRLSWSGKSMTEVASILKISYGYTRKKKCECMAKLIDLVKSSSKYNSLKW